MNEVSPAICIAPPTPPRPVGKSLIAPGLAGEAIAVRGTFWKPNQTLFIGFIGGTKSQYDIVRYHANEWFKHISLMPIWGAELERAQIRISFDPTDGAWSTIGTGALGVPWKYATMNLGSLARSTVLHEFGHMLGLAHEHQNPNEGIKWNKEEVYKDLAGPPNYWDKERVDVNIFAEFDNQEIVDEVFDPQSIMLYRIPPNWTLDGFQSNENTELSELDILTVQNLYPKDPDEEWVDPRPPRRSGCALARIIGSLKGY